MPNYVINKVTINGSVETISKIKEQILNYDDGQGNTRDFSFQTIIPRPKSLDIESSTMVDKAIEYIRANDDEKALIESAYFLDKDYREKYISLANKAIENIKKYGYKDWYDWSRNNWGTKWDAFETSVDFDDTTICLTFQTAWSTPEPVFFELAEQYPDIAIEVEYASEDICGGYCGTYDYEDGSWVHSDEDLEFACKMWGLDPEGYEVED